jgi:hypothetical protein
MAPAEHDAREETPVEEKSVDFTVATAQAVTADVFAKEEKTNATTGS